jgi:hypothetical protein
MAIGLSDILSALQNGVNAINRLNLTLGNIFPQASATTTTISSAGTITYTSSQAKIFITVLTSTGGTYQVPGY